MQVVLPPDIHPMPEDITAYVRLTLLRSPLKKLVKMRVPGGRSRLVATQTANLAGLRPLLSTSAFLDTNMSMVSLSTQAHCL